jgi:hypothetical protein
LDPKAEAVRLIEGAVKQGILLRALGGVAIALRCPSARHRQDPGRIPDLDFATYGRWRGRVKQFFVEEGYEPNRLFNALQGRTRLNFFRPADGGEVDIFLDIFRMCHQLDLAGRLEAHEYTLGLADLLLTKLQVVQLNEKDVLDILALLKDYPLGDEPVGIDPRPIVRLCAADWGWYRTVTLNLGRILGLAPRYVDAADLGLIAGRVRELRAQVEAAPKSLAWRARAAIGERIRWYDLPEDVKGRREGIL